MLGIQWAKFQVRTLDVWGFWVSIYKSITSLHHMIWQGPHASTALVFFLVENLLFFFFLEISIFKHVLYKIDVLQLNLMVDPILIIHFISTPCCDDHFCSFCVKTGRLVSGYKAVVDSSVNRPFATFSSIQVTMKIWFGLIYAMGSSKNTTWSTTLNFHTRILVC